MAAQVQATPAPRLKVALSGPFVWNVPVAPGATESMATPVKGRWRRFVEGGRAAPAW